MAKLCECGCGQATTVATKTSTRHGRVQGQPMRFVQGHNNRIRRREPVRGGICECGCGEPIPENPRRRWQVRFIRGHTGRGNAQRLRDAWPSPEEVRELLEELGTVAAVAERLGRSRTAMLRIVHEYGIEWRPRGFAMVKNTVRTGWAGEEHAALLLGAEIARGSDPRTQPFDLLWHGLRVDVKTAMPTKVRPGEHVLGWTFRVIQNRGKCDFFFCIACAPEGMPLRYFLIPEADVDVENIRISSTLTGRWAAYEVCPTIAPPSPA